MRNQALGLIEVYGYVSAIEAADSAVKSANVELVAVEKVKGGLVTVILSGDVGAVKAAVESGEESARRIGNCKSSHVIPRPVDEVSKMLLKTPIKIEEEKESVETIEEETLSSVDSEMEKVIEEETLPPVDMEMETDFEESQKVEAIVENEASNPEQLIEGLDNMTVVELRKMARSLKMETMTKDQIKRARKNILIEEITRFYEGGNK